MIQPFPRLTDVRSLTPELLNRLFFEVERLSRLTVSSGSAPASLRESATGYHLAIDPPPSLESPLTTKGDIWAYFTTALGSGDGRLPVGASNGQVIVSDSLQVFGMRWTDPPWLLTSTIEVREADGSPDYAGVSVLIFDQADGFALSQPSGGQAKVKLTLPVADATHAGIVSLANQSLGHGKKFFDDQVGIGTTSPLANSALDVRGYGNVYFAQGTLYFGGGNFPASETDGCDFAWDGAVGALRFDVSAAFTGSGGIGFRFRHIGAVFEILHRAGTTPSFGFTNTDTGISSSGISGTFP